METSPSLRQKTPNISVIIPAYNCANVLKRAVNSALAQTDISTPQIVIVDDASSDGTFAVMELLADRHPSVEIYQNPVNSGPGATRNRALEMVTGDWVVLLDADDAMRPQRISRLVARAQQEDVKIIVDLLIFFDFTAKQEEPVQVPTSGKTELLSFRHFIRPDPETKLDFGLLKPIIHRSLIDSGVWQYPDMRHAQDFWTNMTALMAGEKFLLLRESYYIFSTRVGAISGKYSSGSVTAVNYINLAKQSVALEKRLADAGFLTPELQDDLKARETRSLALNRIYGWTTLRKGEFRRHLKWLRQHPQNRWILLSIIGKKLMGHRGLPD
jgi:succinoglycan biosynthesis protein ExoO